MNAICYGPWLFLLILFSLKEYTRSYLGSTVVEPFVLSRCAYSTSLGYDEEKIQMLRKSMIYTILLRLLNQMIQDGELILIENTNLEDFVKDLMTTSAQADLGTSVANWLSTELLKRSEVEELFLSDEEIQHKLQNLEL